MPKGSEPMMDFEKEEKQKAKNLKKAAKGSKSRILIDVAERENREADDNMRAKMRMLSDLYFELTNKLESGDMKWDVAMDDFAKGGKAINKNNPFHTDKKRI